PDGPEAEWARRITCTSSRYQDLIWDSRADVVAHKPLPPSAKNPPIYNVQSVGQRAGDGDEKVTKPEKISTQAPKYSELARLARLQDMVILQAIIDKNGDVVSVIPLKGVPLCLTEEAVLAVQDWKFKPALYKGEPVSVYYNLTVNFRLE
ncbi:MAG: energy transducer TonB, partial [Acidobacteriota bacterium]